MATEAMIDSAARIPRKPVASYDAGAALYQPRASDAAEDVERAKAARTALRMALRRHDCPELPACPVHGQKACTCVSCSDPRHADDWETGLTLLRAIDLAPDLPVTSRKCTNCKSAFPLEAFPADSVRCESCWDKDRVRRESRKTTS